MLGKVKSLFTFCIIERLQSISLKDVRSKSKVK